MSVPVLTCPELEKQFPRLAPISLSACPIGLSGCPIGVSGHPISISGRHIGLPEENENRANTAHLKLEFGLSLVKIVIK